MEIGTMKKRCNVEESPSQGIMAVLIAVAKKVLTNIPVKRRRRARKVL
ncbi:hypothetical protein ALP26_102993 [Pseudomonas savastanoi pv. glycinea]|uniref:Uncharacterized protein n=1 Tax=Pseudomonas savastanoi pv. glycinea TaxID=318 RepID=A0A3M5W5B1_PSESG|nr:hypothetical protein ALQ87_102334 [Pseudomonas savastanoi pv. glycinea]RMN04692.1 hypothetical protein ALQ67_00972 [Pseudomonas savastanoi pv. glycinea]RMO52428.1 hypothetical protein ALQ41_102449 [Pseudomonas savastanoi pv. glycinea]RMU65094.1 hypothetical protein ALP26_102993 [Pseudomonas savastanoi pv. glycinea]